MEKDSSFSSFSGGLNFGKKIYFEGATKSGGGPPSPVKKVQPARCQVEGCKVDLSNAKAYYSRHKVCGMHSKFPKVIVAGIEQRFCQQCSRFHQLPEFDQGKRSCRRRLAGHNERRRKPPLLSSPPPRYRNLCPSMFGHNSKAEGFVMDFGMYPTLTGGERGFGNQGQVPWQRYNSSQNALSDLVQVSAPYLDSTSVLSLLSNQPWAPKTRAFSGLGGTNGTAMVQPTTALFGCSSWAEMPPDLGLGQSSHPNDTGLAPQPNEGQFHELDHHRVRFSSPAYALAALNLFVLLVNYFRQCLVSV